VGVSLLRKNLVFSGIILSGIVLFIGCSESQHSGAAKSGQSRPSYMVSVDELATKLGLAIKKTGNPHYELIDAKNTVRLFTHTSGQVYVNGTSVGTVGDVTEIGNKTYVSELLVPKIRSRLIAPEPVRLPNLSYKAPRSFGSGSVVIDPGHGGDDPGAQSVLGYWEKDINLKIAHKLASYLRNAGINVFMTRETDVYPTLEERAALANRHNADLFVSIHCDSNGDRLHKGFTIYRARSASWSAKKAGRILENHLSNAGIPSKGLRGADYRVLVQTRCPAVLVECGFMSNYDEAALLMDPWYQNKIARAIADGILEYL
jgi:N-acetylmuramoyl-L-alanine amidase